MTTEQDPFAIRTSTPAVSFKDVPEGTVREGKVLNIDTDVQGLDYTTRQPATWPSGDPKLSIVITLKTSEGEKALWVTKYAKNAMFQAIATAQQDAGRVLQVGDNLKVAYTGKDPNNPDRKLYRAKIETGTVGGASDPFKKDEVPF